MASGEYSVLTPERVSLEYRIAGIGSRGAAVVVDTVIQAVTLIVGFVALSVAFALTISGEFFQGLTTERFAVYFALLFLAIFIVTFGYFMFFEIVWSGQTPGKRLVGVRVMRENGYPIRPVDAVIRNLVRMVDWLPFFYGLGVLVMLLNKRSRRLGDFASGTIVVREGSRGASLVFAPPPSNGPPINGLLTNEPLANDSRGYALSNRDATLIRDFLVRRASMHPKARAELAHRLAAAIALRYTLAQSDADPELFLQHLVS